MRGIFWKIVENWNYYTCMLLKPPTKCALNQMAGCATLSWVSASSYLCVVLHFELNLLRAGPGHGAMGSLTCPMRCIFPTFLTEESYYYVTKKILAQRNCSGVLMMFSSLWVSILCCKLFLMHNHKYSCQEVELEARCVLFDLG